MMGCFRIFLAFAFLSTFLSAQTELVPIRTHIQKCAALLGQGAHGEASLGALLTEGAEEAQLVAAFQTRLKEDGEKAFEGKTLFFTGIEMTHEAEIAQRARRALATAGADPSKTHIQVLSIPRKKVETYREFLSEWFRYYFPSITRDYQPPTSGEVVSGAVSTLIVEIPVAYYLLTERPTPDGQITLLNHAFLLASYTVYKQFLANWLLRSRGNLELVTKQLLLSLPFILNYNLFGNTTAIWNFLSENGIAGMVAQLPTELSRFATTQGLTMVLQTLFYSLVITRGIRGWEASQKDEANEKLARKLGNYFALPWLWADAYILAMAATQARPLFEMGVFGVNQGHLMLAGLTAIGTSLIVTPLLNGCLWTYQGACNIARYMMGSSTSNLR